MLLHLLYALLIPHTLSHSLAQWRRIRELEEMSVDVLPHQESRFHLRVSDPHAPLFMAITPCGGTVHWQLYNVSADIISSLMEPQPFAESSEVELLAGEAGDRRMNYFIAHTGSERIVLVLTSNSPATARIFFANSQSGMDRQYPPLPKDTRLVHALSVPKGTSTSVLLTWKIADLVRSAEPGKYRFCAIVSRKENDWALCDHIDEGLESIHCVEKERNSLTLEKIRTGKRYFVTLFVRDSVTGSTSSYSTLTVDVPDSGEKSARRDAKKMRRQGIALYDAALKSDSLPARKGAVINYDFQFVPVDAASSKRLLLVVHSCDGFVRLNVFRNGKLLRRSEPFSGFRRFLILNVRGGQIRFQVVNDDSSTKEVRLWASTRPDKSPYPLLPDDTSIKVSRHTCSSATLQWMRAPDEHVEYCLYKRKEEANFLEELVSKVDNLCSGGFSSSTLVGCYSHRGPQTSGEVDGLIETKVDGLRPLKTYRFDLLARPLHRPNSQYLPYRTVWVRTTNNC